MITSSLPNAQSGSRHAQFTVQGPVGTGDYLGAQVNPSNDATQIESQTETLETQIYGTPPRHLALHMHYRNWTQMLQIGSDNDVKADISHGRVPVISWRCGDDAPPNKAATPLNLIQIANGEADSDLALIKTQLLMLKYPGTSNSYPVGVRYFWEFNINAGQVGPAYDNASIDPNGNNGCFVKPGTQTGILAEPTAPALPQQFIDAWNHIHQQLSGGAPVPQLTYIWNPNVVDSDPSYGGGAVVNPGQFYPGPNTVDWIGVDGYQRLDPTSHQPKKVTDIFGAWYIQFSSFNKPMIIGETGSCSNYAIGFQTDQAAYLRSLDLVLRGTPPNPDWSHIRALMYFDAKGTYKMTNGPLCDWRLDPATESEGQTGIQALAALAQDPFFAPTVQQP